MKNTLEQLSGEFIKILGGLELNGGCNIMAKNGIEVSYCKYFILQGLRWIAKFVLNGKHGFIDETGREVILVSMMLYSPFYEG